MHSSSELEWKKEIGLKRLCFATFLKPWQERKVSASFCFPEPDMRSVSQIPFADIEALKEKLKKMPPWDGSFHPGSDQEFLAALWVIGRNEYEGESKSQSRLVWAYVFIQWYCGLEMKFDNRTQNSSSRTFPQRLIDMGKRIVNL